MAAPHLGPVSPEAYLRMERLATTRHELVDGTVYAISGASRSHVRIVGNLYFQVRSKLSKRCEAFLNDMRVAIHATSVYTYPDLSISCGDAVFEDAQLDTLTNPLVLVEVLSPSTAAYDRGLKFFHYQKIPSLRAYLLVAQDAASVELFVKNDAGEWVHHFVVGRANVISLAGIGISISMSDLYDGVEVPDDLPALPSQKPSVD